MTPEVARGLADLLAQIAQALMLDENKDTAGWRLKAIVEDLRTLADLESYLHCLWAEWDETDRPKPQEIDLVTEARDEVLDRLQQESRRTKQ